MKKIFVILLFNFLFCIYLSGQNFGTAIKDEADSLWTQTPETFKTTFGSPKIYKWKSALKNVLIYNSKGSETELFFFEHPIDKAFFSFKSKQLQGIRLIFERPKVISDKETYLEYSSKLVKQVSILSKDAPKARERKTKNAYRCTYSWVSPEYYISLKCSYTIDLKKTFKPGQSRFSIFRRIPMILADKKIKAASETAPETASETAGDSTIKTNDKGDRYLEVPMLKEESPKECLYYSVKRIFDYYKTAPKDRNWQKIKKNMELKVKSPKGLKRVFSSVIGECRCEVKVLSSTSIFDNFNSIMTFVRDYNKKADEMGKSRINSFNAVSFSKLIRLMNEDVLVKTRNNPRETASFKSEICKEIDEAKPVLWIVFLGVVKENVKPLAPSGGYVRLIVGYNPKTSEVIYTDSWGKGHELKKMAWEKAWAMTLAALAVTVKK